MAKRIIRPETRIVVPYVPGKLHPDTENWAKGYECAELTELDPADDAAYFKLISELWQQPGELIIVEQDMLPTRTTVERMLNCTATWCTATYQINGGTWINNGLGVVKFGAGLRKKWPGLMVRVGYITDDGSPQYSWRRLDTRIALTLYQMDLRPHWDHAAVEHLHDYSQD